MDEQNPLTITIAGTTVTLEGEAIIGFALNNLVNTLTATTDQSEEWNYTLTVHMIVQDVYNVINLNRSGQTLSVDLTADMLPYSGRYEMQFVATNGDYVSHTDIFEVFVKNTLDPVKQYTPVPSEFYQIQKDVQQNAQLAQSSANQAEQSATDAEGYATQAQQSAQDASGYLTQVQESANEAEQSATQAAESATQAAQSAQTAQTAVDSIGDSVQQAQTAASNAQQSATSASESASEASTSAQQAASSATAAQNAQQAIENMTVFATTLAPGSDASVTKTTDQGIVNLEFGIPQGEKGDAGLGVPVPTVDDANDVPVVNSTGTAYELQPYTNDNAVGANPWSSKQIVDSFCPPFTISGSVVTCNPVVNYPLSVQSEIVAVQSGSGDPSPDNVRPISGWDEANLVLSGKNLFDKTNGIVIDGYISGSVVTAGMFQKTIAIRCIPGKTYTITKGVTTATTAIVFTATEPIIGSQGFDYQNFDGADVATITAPENAKYFVAYIFNSNLNPELNADTVLSAIQIEYGNVATPYEPYQGQTITLPFGQVVYGGTLDWNAGVLTVTHAEIASYSGEALPGAWISDRDVYSQGATPTTGAQVVYELSVPRTIQLTTTEMLALSGTNTLYTDTGDTTVSGRQDLINYLQSLSSAVLGG